MNKPARSRKKKAGTPGPDEPISERVVLNTKGLFIKDLSTMMYGFGDDQAPYKESVELVEEIMMDFVVQSMERAVAAAAFRGGKPTEKDLLFLVRKDPRMYARVRELLRLQEDIVNAKKAFNEEEMLKGEIE